MSEKKENPKVEVGKVVGRESEKDDEEFAFNLVARKLVRKSPADSTPTKK